MIRCEATNGETKSPNVKGKGGDEPRKKRGPSYLSFKKSPRTDIVEKLTERKKLKKRKPLRVERGEFIYPQEAI